jgi:hypothetical protein
VKVVSATLLPVANAAFCSVTQTGGWITAASHPSTAVCALTFTANYFSAPPNCVASNDAFVSTISSVSAGGLTVDVEGTNGAPYSDGRPIHIVCVGLP